MKKIKVRMKASEMRDADVSYISLVDRPASRIPFRVLKSESSKESKMKTFFSDLFKSTADEIRDPKPRVVAAVIQKADSEKLLPKLKEAGLYIDKIEEKDGVLVVKQEEFNMEDVKAVKITEEVALLVNATKYFDSYPYYGSVEDQTNAALFYPGVCTATDVLKMQIDRVLSESHSAEEARVKLKDVVTQYSKYVMGLSDLLPEIAFKIEGGLMKKTEDVTKGGAPAAEVVAETTAKAEETPKVEEAAEQVEAEKAANDKKYQDMTPEEQKAFDAEKAKNKDKKKEDLSTDIKKSETSSVNATETVQVTAEAVKSEAEASKQNDQVALMLQAITDLGTKLTAGLEAVNAVAQKSIQAVDELKGRVEAAEGIAKKAEKAVQSTVVVKSESEELPNETLGTMSRAGSQAKKGEADLWGGTNLDKIGL